MYKKLNLFAYKFVVICQGFFGYVVPREAENWHMNNTFRNTVFFLDICQCDFKNCE